MSEWLFLMWDNRCTIARCHSLHFISCIGCLHTESKGVFLISFSSQEIGTHGSCAVRPPSIISIGWGFVYRKVLNVFQMYNRAKDKLADRLTLNKKKMVDSIPHMKCARDMWVCDGKWLLIASTPNVTVAWRHPPRARWFPVFID